jgi:hypothetical protein
MSGVAAANTEAQKAEILADKKASRDRRLTTRAAESALYASQLDALRDRYRSAFGECQNVERTTAARHMFVAAGIFERDARHFPKRAKKAIEQMALAVFMLESKVAR